MEKNPRKYLNQKDIERIVSREKEYLQKEQRKQEGWMNFWKTFRYVFIVGLTLLILRWAVKWLLN